MDHLAQFLLLDDVEAGHFPSTVVRSVDLFYYTTRERYLMKFLKQWALIALNYSMLVPAFFILVWFAFRYYVLGNREVEVKKKFEQ